MEMGILLGEVFLLDMPFSLVNQYMHRGRDHQRRTEKARKRRTESRTYPRPTGRKSKLCCPLPLMRHTSSNSSINPGEGGAKALNTTYTHKHLR